MRRNLVSYLKLSNSDRRGAQIGFRLPICNSDKARQGFLILGKSTALILRRIVCETSFYIAQA